MTLRVALISTPFVPVPPKGYGGTELVVAELAKALTAKGTDVVVYATGDSDLPGIEVRSYFPAAQWPPDRDIERVHATWSLRDAARDPRGFDVVHVHSPAAVEMARISPWPVICTLHHHHVPELSDLYARTPEVRLIAISRSQARQETAKVAAVVHHGLDPSRYRPMDDQGYLLFLGRYDRVKGVAAAIEVASRARLPLVMAGEPHERDYFDAEVQPLIARHGVLELGPVGGSRKAALLARARALLFPIEWEEPFGLVTIEAMLSGVPVLGTSRGAVPEILDDGITGVICDDPAEMVAAARIADKLFDRRRIRTGAIQRWSAARMADDYLEQYRRAQAEPFVAAADAAAAEG
ncbi:MAG: glycosyltransferase family 4 protein [Deltaproteobacteria bacterium]|nr:MAG: glycosyltransferase family 4 protein [Deltaproteobacteria bacterium]